MTSVAVNTYTHSVTYVADNILKSLKDIIRLSGLDPSEFVGDWELNMRGVQTWLNTGDLESVELEIYDPMTDVVRKLCQSPSYPQSWLQCLHMIPPASGGGRSLNCSSHPNRRRQGHARWSGAPHQRHFFIGQSIGTFDHRCEPALVRLELDPR